MKQETETQLRDRNKVLEKELRDICNLIMKIKRKATENGWWLSAGVNPHVELTDDAQQGPLVTELYAKVESIRTYIRKDK